MLYQLHRHFYRHHFQSFRYDFHGTGPFYAGINGFTCYFFFLLFFPSFFFFFWQDFECRSSSSQVNLHDSSSYFGEGVSIFISGISGIPEWIMDQNLGNHVTTNLPQDWYEDKDFLGFALCSVYVPLDDKSEDDFEHGFED